MSKVCRVCSHPRRLDVDREIVAGGNLTSISEKYGVPYYSIHYHKEHHLSRQILKHAEIREILHSKELLAQISDLFERSRGILDRAERDNKLGVALGAIRESRSTIELLAKIAYVLREQQPPAPAPGEAMREQVERMKERLSEEELVCLYRLTAKLDGRIPLNEPIELRPAAPAPDTPKARETAPRPDVPRRTRFPRRVAVVKTEDPAVDDTRAMGPGPAGEKDAECARSREPKWTPAAGYFEDEVYGPVRTSRPLLP